MNIIRLIRVSGTVDTILRIIQKVLFVCAIVSGVFIILTFAAGEAIVADTSSIDFGPITLIFAQDAIPEFHSIRAWIIFELINFIVLSIAGWYLIRVIRSIIEPMKEGKPFENGISAKVRKLSWTFLVAGAILELSRLGSSFALVKAYDPSLFLDPAVISDFSFHYSFNGAFLVVFGVLFFLSLIFGYGESLQRESDETL